MRENNVSLRESLMQLPTPQLDAMLRGELAKDVPDAHAVRLILNILKEREADFPVETNGQIETAWERYLQKTAPKTSPLYARVFKAAAVLLLCGALLFALPQKASADNFFDRIAVWTEQMFGLFGSRDAEEMETPYQFRTNHPGLQQLYDTVAAEGVTVPVVPMWLDTAYELQHWEVTRTPKVTKIRTSFFNGEYEAVFEVNIYADTIPRKFHKDKSEAAEYERNGIIHYVLQNGKLWTVILERDNIDCFITLDCPEDDVYRMIDSIYTMED